jgi:Zn-dependent protease
MKMSQEVVLILFQVLVLVFAFSVHESAHAYTALRLGDPTAFMLGRVTLNPAKHLDPFGSVLIPLIGLFTGGWLIGWAKPCPITPRNFRNIRRDEILTALAGPASNLVMAAVALMLLVVLKHWVPGGFLSIIAAMATANHASLNLAGLRLFPLAMLLYYGILINLLLFVFNLIPLPPLDGSIVLRQFLPPSLDQAYSRIGIWGFLLFFVLGGRLLGVFYNPLLNAFNHALGTL